MTSDCGLNISSHSNKLFLLDDIQATRNSQVPHTRAFPSHKLYPQAPVPRTPRKTLSDHFTSINFHPINTYVNNRYHAQPPRVLIITGGSTKILCIQISHMCFLPWRFSHCHHFFSQTTIMDDIHI